MGAVQKTRVINIPTEAKRPAGENIYGWCVWGVLMGAFVAVTTLVVSYIGSN